MTPKTRGSDRRIGLVADTHGNLEALRECVDHCLAAGADRLVHLGDLFDSLKHDHLTDLSAMVLRFGMRMVKGNNEVQVENALSAGTIGGLGQGDQKRLMAFLSRLPLNLVEEGLCFAHSLPFDSVRSLYEPVDTGDTSRACQVFARTPHQVLCCGHSHRPVVFRHSPLAVTRETMGPGETLLLSPAERYIIVVGASETGQCGLLDTRAQTYTRLGTGA